VPPGPWRRAWLLAGALAVVFLGGYERWGRASGYVTRIADTPLLWTNVRRTVGTGSPDETVIIGSSRVLTAVDLDAYAAASGLPKPKQLALLGGSPLPFLEDLAADERFVGTVLCGVTPHRFYHPPETHPFLSNAFSGYSLFWQPFEERLASRTRAALVLRSPELLLDRFLRRLASPGNAKPIRSVGLRPDRSQDWSFAGALGDRRPEPPLSRYDVAPPTPEEFERLLARASYAARKIGSRGGRVVFVRMPSSGATYEIEQQLYPRTPYWDALLDRTGAVGVHFEDYPSLSGFELADGAHIDVQDKADFTRALRDAIEKAASARRAR
jgi:hypothetical protein